MYFGVYSAVPVKDRIGIFGVINNDLQSSTMAMILMMALMSGHRETSPVYKHRLGEPLHTSCKPIEFDILAAYQHFGLFPP